MRPKSAFWRAGLYAAVALIPLLAGRAWAAGPLAIINANIQQTEDGTPLPAGFTHVPGDILFFSFQLENYTVSAQQKIKLSYTIDALDPRGVKIMETVEAVKDTDVSPQDKQWKPKIRQEIVVPPLADSGTYKIKVTAKDDLANTSATKEIPIEVRGRDVPPSDTLVVRNFRYFRSEEDPDPLAKAVYRPGDAVWARFDITGYKFGEGNKIDVSYGIAVLTGEGKVLWSQAEAAVEQSTSFYPKRYVPGSMSINLQPNIRTGEYAITVTVHDRIGKQDYEIKEPFNIEK